MPVVPSCLLEPLWDQVAALLPERGTALERTRNTEQPDINQAQPEPLQLIRFSASLPVP